MISVTSLYKTEMYEIYEPETGLRFSETGRVSHFSFIEAALKPVCLCITTPPVESP